MNQAEISRQRYVPWVVIVAPAMALSAVAWAQQAQVPSMSVLWWLLALVLLGAGLSWQRRPIGWLLLGIGLGCVSMQLSIWSWQQQQLPAVWADVPFEAQVSLTSVPREYGARWQVEGVIEQAPTELLQGMKVLLWWSGSQAPEPSEIWLGRLRLSAISGRHNPGGMDVEAWLFSQQIMASGVFQAQHLQRQASVWSWQWWRWQLFARLSALMPNESSFSGLNIALIMGIASGVTAEQWQVLRDTGVLHLAVVSGMHITLVAGLLWGVVWVVWQLSPSQRYAVYQWAMPISLLGAVLFAFMAGWTVPVQRALLMLLVVYVGYGLRRRLHPVLTLSWAMLLVLLWDVSAVLQVGFWLSFIATGLLLWLLQRPQVPWLKLVLIHVGMSVLMAPFLAFFFHQIPTYAPLANILVAPIIEFVLVPMLLLSAVFAGWLPSVTQFLLQQAQWLWSMIWSWLLQIAQLPLAVWLLSPAMMLSGSIATPQITVLDTDAQALVAIWQTPKGTWLIGTGTQVGRSHTMDQVILPSLLAMGIDRISGVVLLDDSPQAKVGLTLLQHRLGKQPVWLADSLCETRLILPFGHGVRDELGQCWLQLDHGVMLHWRSPMLMAPAAQLVIAPAPKGKSLSFKQPLWVSPDLPAHDSWAKSVLGTRCMGAMTFRWQADEWQLFRAYRYDNQRFYHGACQ